MTTRTANDLEWNDLSLILAIGRGNGLSGASRALGQTHSTVFRRINAVEERTGVRFFDRFRKGYVATEAGQKAIEYAERIEAEVHALGLEVLGQGGELRGRIRLTCPEVFAQELAPGIAARFLAKHPEIRLDVTPGHGTVDLNKREAEVAIRATRSPPDSAYGRRICDFRFATFATPEYMGEHGETPIDQHDLCVIEGAMSWLVPQVLPSLEHAIERTVFQCSATKAVQNAIAAGMGIGFLPCYVGDVDDRLIRVTETFPHLDMKLWILTHPDLRNTARVRALMTHLYDDLAYDIDVFAGLTKTPSGDTNLLVGKA